MTKKQKLHVKIGDKVQVISGFDKNNSHNNLYNCSFFLLTISLFSEWCKFLAYPISQFD